MFQDSVYDSLFNNNVVPKKQNKPSSNSKKQASSKPNSTTDDFSYLFGMGGNILGPLFRSGNFVSSTCKWVGFDFVLAL